MDEEPRRGRFRGWFLASLMVAALVVLVAITVGILAWVRLRVEEDRIARARQPLPAPERMEGLLPEVDAALILAKSAAVYANCRTYTDTGEQRSSFTFDGGTDTKRATFATSFVRYGGFRLDHTRYSDRPRLLVWLDTDERLVIWGSHAWARLWSSGTEWPNSYQPLRSQLGVADGLSRGNSCRIPRLLMPDARPEPTPLTIDEAKLVGAELVSGHACYRIEGTAGDHECTTWIDAHSVLVRRTKERVDQRGLLVVDTLTAYEPTLDVEIPPSVFEFEPPK